MLKRMTGAAAVLAIALAAQAGMATEPVRIGFSIAQTVELHFVLKRGAADAEGLRCPGDIAAHLRQDFDDRISLHQFGGFFGDSFQSTAGFGRLGARAPDFRGHVW